MRTLPGKRHLYGFGDISLARIEDVPYEWAEDGRNGFHIVLLAADNGTEIRLWACTAPEALALLDEIREAINAHEANR